MSIFSILKNDPIKKLAKLYESKLEEAMYAQRKVNIKLYALNTAEADKFKMQILALQTSSKTP